MSDSELFLAIKNNDTELAKALLEKKARPGVTELFAACVRGLTEIVKLIILAEDARSSKYNKKAVEEYVNAYDYGETPLILTCKKGHIQTANLLIENGADVNYSTLFGTPLSFAVEYGHFNIARLIIQKILLKDLNQQKPDFIEKNIELSKYWNNCKSLCETPFNKTQKDVMLDKINIEKNNEVKTKPASLFFSTFSVLSENDNDLVINQSSTNTVSDPKPG